MTGRWRSSFGQITSIVAAAVLLAFGAADAGAVRAPAREFPVSRYGASGDGGNQIDALRRAVSAANEAGGGSVVLNANTTYLIKTSRPYEAVLLPHRNVRIVGAKGATLKVDVASADGPIMVDGGYSDTVVEGVKFDLSHKTDSIAIKLNGSSNNVVVNNTFENAGFAAVYLVGATTDTTVSHNVSTGGGYGVLTQDSSTAAGVNITDNNFGGGSSGDGVALNTPTGSAHGWNITHNVISGFNAQGPASGFGISIAHGSDIDIEGNYLAGNTNHGIHLEDGASYVEITQNTIRDDAKSAIYMVSGPRTVSHITISGNLITGCAFASTASSNAIWAEGGGAFAFNDIEIIGNRLVGNGMSSTPSRDINVDYGPDDVQIRRNTISGNIGLNPIGIFVSGLGATSGSSVVISGNKIVNEHGIYLTGNQVSTDVFANTVLDKPNSGVPPIVNTGTGTIHIHGNRSH
jgi:parallel beta-helix repeat protein